MISPLNITDARLKRKTGDKRGDHCPGGRIPGGGPRIMPEGGGGIPRGGMPCMPGGPCICGMFPGNPGGGPRIIPDGIFPGAIMPGGGPPTPRTGPDNPEGTVGGAEAPVAADMGKPRPAARPIPIPGIIPGIGTLGIAS